ncbi:MAG TPA: choice-of-anchor D domain-containing protein, partial [Anaerolineae bacterium]|nr:choice-of-anchor D domain-containing protein [Anaerolineae bacterium]
DAVLVLGVRPDVEAAYPAYPNNDRAGWQYLLLTHFLPNGGNGTYTLQAIATDVEGHSTVLGTKTIIADNANAVKPFGMLDTPVAGGTACGSSHVVWGWALTPQPNAIPTDGSTINIYVDGVNLGHPVYNMYRADIAAFFPGYANSNGAVFYMYLDTTAYASGVHTIQATAVDSAGNADGIGSRYFTIQNPCPSDAPVAEVLGNGQPITNGDTTPSSADNTAFGTVELGGSVARTYTLKNNGTGRLIMNGCTGIGISGPHSRDFRVSMQPASIIAEGGSSQFQISFEPSEPGLREATVRIGSNAGSFTFDVNGTGLGGTIVIIKKAEPQEPQEFWFEGDLGTFVLDDWPDTETENIIVFEDIGPGIYRVAERVSSGEWGLESIVCQDPDGSTTTDLGTAAALIDLAPDETVTCTFSNGRRSLLVSKELVLPVGASVGGPAAVDQILRFDIAISNDGGLTIDPLTLRDKYPWGCMRSWRAYDENEDPLPPDAHGGTDGLLRWDNLGPLAPGQTKRLSVEFKAAAACEKATNTAIITSGDRIFQDSATVRILDSVARFAGRAYHDANGNGELDTPCSGTDVTPAGCEPGVERAQAILISPDARALGDRGVDASYLTSTSGWYSFNLLEPGTYRVAVDPPAGSWWTPTTVDDQCVALIRDRWDEVHCNVGYSWGRGPDGPAVDSAAAATASPDQMTLTPVQDTTLNEWQPGNHGAENYLNVRQPGVASAALQFDLSDLPDGATIVSARLRLYSPFASNGTNRLYMTAYPLDKPWTEGEATWLSADAVTPWESPGAVLDHGDPVGWGWISAPGSAGAAGWVEFDLDPATLLDSGNGILIRGEGTWNREVAYSFFSKEYGNP